jgi:transcriptional repressor NrdR
LSTRAPKPKNHSGLSVLYPARAERVKENRKDGTRVSGIGVRVSGLCSGLRSVGSGEPTVRRIRTPKPETRFFSALDARKRLGYDPSVSVLGADYSIRRITLPREETAVRCPQCSSDAKVRVNYKRDQPSGQVRRRLRCEACDVFFYTVEKIEPQQIKLKVIKRNNSKESFDPDKIRRGIALACLETKHDVRAERINAMVTRITDRILNQKSRTVRSEDIALLVLQELKKEHLKAAYVRFAMVTLHRLIKGRNEFEKILSDFIKKIEATPPMRERVAQLGG